MDVNKDSVRLWNKAEADQFLELFRSDCSFMDPYSPQGFHLSNASVSNIHRLLGKPALLAHLKDLFANVTTGLLLLLCFGF